MENIGFKWKIYQKNESTEKYIEISKKTIILSLSRL